MISFTRVDERGGVQPGALVHESARVVGERDAVELPEREPLLDLRLHRLAQPHRKASIFPFATASQTRRLRVVT